MKSREGTVWFKLKDIHVTCISVLFVILVFLLQCLLIHHLYVFNVNLLERELDLSMDEVYKTDLSHRLELYIEDGMSHTQSYLSRNKICLDSANLKLYKDRLLAENAMVSTVNVALEECLNETTFINLAKLDSIAHIVLVKNNINFNFYSEIINPKTNDVFNSTMPSKRSFFKTFKSKEIPLNKANTKALRIVLINPMSHFYWQMGIMIVSSLILSVILISSFYYQRRVLAKEKKLVDFKNHLFADISHEMKKPLSVMSLVVSSFEKEPILVDEEKRTSFLRMAKVEIERMASQTEMVLSLAKDDEGMFDLNCVEFDIVEMVSGLADKYTYISEKELKMEIVDEMNKPSIYADPEHVEHILTNLITNAIKYSFEPVLIVVRLYEEKHYICISVKDNGVGLTKDQQKRVFDRYYRAGTVLDAKGHGIGLNYVKRVVEKCNGKILLYSEPNKGSEFIVKLPLLNKA